MGQSLTLAAASNVAIQGSFGGHNVLAGETYYVVAENSGGIITAIGEITGEQFSTGDAFTISVDLPAGSYSIGTVGQPTGSTINIYIADATGASGGGNSESRGNGAAHITATLSATVVRRRRLHDFEPVTAEVISELASPLGHQVSLIDQSDALSSRPGSGTITAGGKSRLAAAATALSGAASAWS
jgi:hypothetical protein